MARRDNITKTVGTRYFALVPGQDTVCNVVIESMTDRTVVLSSRVWHYNKRYATDDVNFLEIINNEEITDES